jgi:hypothetical protein
MGAARDSTLVASEPEHPSEDIAALLAQAFAERFTSDSGQHIAAHRWLHAAPNNPLADRFWDPALRIGVVGDWCSGPRIEAPICPEPNWAKRSRSENTAPGDNPARFPGASLEREKPVRTSP